MTTLRKWRFPILIGSGLIAAGILFYFSSTHISSDKTQGAIGKRDVYRDGQVTSADVATPGSAPVATTAILESSEFKALAKNPAFQELMKDSSFSKLSRDSNFAGLMANASFLTLASDPQFSRLVNSGLFSQYLKQGMNRNELFAAMKNDAAYSGLAQRSEMVQLMQNQLFLSMARLGEFRALVGSQALQNAMAQPALVSLLSQGALQRMAVMGGGGATGGGCDKSGGGEGCGGTR